MLSFLLLGVGLVTLPGCGPHRLRVDYRSFEMAYADTSNHEVLLNLARLQNRDPTYFFKLGQITSQYRMNATLSGNGSYINSGTSAPGFGNVTGGGNPALLYENDPSFTFIPVDDGTNAQLVLKPVPPETFYDLYQQGWRIDQLFRLLVDRLEYTIPTFPSKGPGSLSDSHPAPNGCQVVTLRNVPPATLGSSETAKAELSQYVTFLRVSALMYALQKHGHLLLKGNSSFVPVDPNSYLPIDSDGTRDIAARKADEPKDKSEAGAHSGGSGPAAKDINDAAAKDQSWRLSADGTKWVLGKTTLSPQFYLNPLLTPSATSKDQNYLPNLAEIGDDIKQDPDFQVLKLGQTMDNSLKALVNGFSIEGTPGPQTGNPCTASPHLYLRSLLGLMAAAAQEELPFETLRKSAIPIPPSPGEVRDDMTFIQLVPPVEQTPTLRISPATGQTEDTPLAVLTYPEGKNKKTYEIADVTGSDIPPDNLFWNRDMFRLIVQLTSQVTVDISKFPLPTTLQLHQ